MWRYASVPICYKPACTTVAFKTPPRVWRDNAKHICWARRSLLSYLANSVGPVLALLLATSYFGPKAQAQVGNLSDTVGCRIANTE